MHSLAMKTQTRQLLVIDPQVEDYQQLIKDLEPDTELLILDPNRDGIEQITAYLTSLPAGETGRLGDWETGSPPVPPPERQPKGPRPEVPPAPHLPSLHIISHGSPGHISLGNTTLELNNLEKYRPQIQQWGKYLGENADILLYGCNVAATEIGKTFVKHLHHITNANIAASAHPVGNPKKGGTWNLEHTVGNITSPITLSPEVCYAYPGIFALSFSAASNFAVGTNPKSVTVGDFNNDGNLDIASANQGSDNISVLLGTGSGSFGAKTDYAVSNTPQSVTVGDFNGDNNLDIASANWDSNNISILLGTGTGSFNPASHFAVGTGSGAFSVSTKDLNADGFLDLVAANLFDTSVSVLLGTGTGGFGAASTFAIGTNSYSATLGDFNGDGNLDIAAANKADDNVSILLGTGSGSFGAKTDFAVGTAPRSVAAADFNSDGKLDLAVANSSSWDISVLLGTGTGSFGPATNFSVWSVESVAVGDFDGDSKLDIAATSFSGNSIAVLLGDGAGSFSAATDFTTATGPRSVAVGDFNGDGKLDIVAGNYNSSDVSVLLNTTIPDTTPPTVTIEQATGQTDPATTSPISFTVTFSETVTGFDAADISFTGSTAGGTLTPTITGSGTTYNVAVAGMTTSGTVVPSVIANAATDAAGNPSVASTSTDNTVTYNTIPTVSNITKTGNEDSNITFATADFTAVFSDVDNDSLNKIQITTLPTNGTLQLNGGNVTLSQEILLASIPNLTFTPTADFNGSSSFTWNGSDGSNYATTDATANLTIAAINDAPSFTNAGNQTLTNWTNTTQTIPNWANTFVFGPTNENTQTVADFLVNVTSGNTLFTTLPDIANDGTLTYTPNGTPGTATVQVQLKDNGGVANGGVDTSAAATFTITVPPPTVNLSVNTTTGTEAGTTAITLTATAQGAVVGNQTLNLALTGTASDADFSGTIPAQITIADGSSGGQVTLNVADDLIDEGDETATFTFSNPTAGIVLGTTTAQTITITDNDTAGITVTPTAGLTTTEAGVTATFTVALNTQPTADVTINLSSDNTAEGTIDKTSLVFTTADWNTAQTVTITGVDDLVADGDIAYNIITAAATSTDAKYNGMNAADVAVSNSDNDSPTGGGTTPGGSGSPQPPLLTPSLPNGSAIIDNTPGIGLVEPVGRMDVIEGGGEDIYELLLATKPTANVDIAIITDGKTTANVDLVSFTSDNWNIPQLVRMSAVDDNVVEGFHTSNVRLVATSLDGDYNNFPIGDIIVSIADNENVGWVRSFANPTNLMASGGDDNLVGSARGDIINARGGNNVVDGGAGDDVLLGGNDADYITGGAGLDQILSGPGEDYVDGGDDDDVIFAGTGSDRLYGGAGNDKLFGEQGNDYLVGGAGVDTLTGGAGRDAFAIGNGQGGMTVAMADVITDFVIGEDVIDLIAPLGYDGVAISDGTGLYAGDALVQNALTGEFLARLQAVDARSLTRSDFV
ncbi:MAG: hypothetical protein Fur0025_04740 [Oscillatoriaceae cyanobacterium]